VFVPQIPGPSRQVAIGATISLLFFGTVLLCLNGCGTTLSSAVVECKLNALEHLIDQTGGDPMRVTPYDGAELVERVKACHEAPADAGQR
jgi:hypothetical protein